MLPVLALLLQSSPVWAQAPSPPVGAQDSKPGEPDLGEVDTEDSDTEDSEASDQEPADQDTALDLDEPGLRMIVRGERGTPRVAGSAQSLSEEDLELFEYDDITRVLNAQVPGVSTRTEDGYGLRPNIGIRGVNSERSSKVSLMEDGVLLAPGPYAAPAAYYFPMSTRMVGMEVFKGPAAVRYGPNTVGGALNLITRPVPTDGFDGQLDLAGGLYQTGKVHAWAGYGGERWGVLGEVAHLQSGGFKELDNGGPTGFSHTEAMAKVAFRPDPKQQWQLKLGYTHETSFETYTGLNAADFAETPYRRYLATANDRMDFQRGQAELSHSLRRGQWELRSVAAVHALDRSWGKLNGFEDGPTFYDVLKAPEGDDEYGVYMDVLRGDADSGDLVLEYGTRDRQYLSSSVQSTARWSTHGEHLSQQLELGARVHVDQVWRTHTADFMGVEGGALVDLDRETRLDQDSYAQARALSVYATDDLRFGRLHVLPGLRLEAIQSFKHELTEARPDPVLRVTPLPGLAVLHEHNSWWSSFAGVHRGFTPVAPGQEAEVDPEVSWNYEAGVRFHQGPTQLEVVGFFNDYSNLTGQCSVSGGCVGEQVDLQYNGGAVFVEGGELAARHTIFLPAQVQLPVEATYTFTHTRFRTAFVSEFPQFGSVQIGDSLPYLPRHQASARVGLQRERLHLAAGVMYRGAMLDEAGAWPPSDSADVPAQVLVDATIHVQASERLEVYAVGTNLLNDQSHTSWRPVGLRPSAPRQVMLGVKVTPGSPATSTD
ncbi:MAG: TonB-dependent receptor [Myxococcota bacterium]|nr:TonB-dependent receptor [Myxococcota bacterium]